MSSGFTSCKLVTSTLSTKISGCAPPSVPKVPVFPLSLMVGFSPIWPLGIVICKPGVAPCKALPTSVTGLDSNTFVSTVETEPVRLARF